eukprot:486760_1
MALCVWLLLVTIIPLSSAVIHDFPVHARAHPIVTAEQIADPSESDPDDNQKFVTVLMDCPVCAPHSKMKLHLWSKPANFREICGAFDDVRDSLSRHPDEGSSNDEEGSSSGDEESSRNDEGSSRPQCAFANKGEDLGTLIDCLRHAVDAIEHSEKLRRSKHDTSSRETNVDSREYEHNYYRRRMPGRSASYDDSSGTLPGRRQSFDDSHDPSADQRGSAYEVSVSGDGSEEEAVPAHASEDAVAESLDVPRHGSEEPLFPRHETEEARGHAHRGHERNDDSLEPPPVSEYERDAPNLVAEVMDLENCIHTGRYLEALKLLLRLKKALGTAESGITIMMEDRTSSLEDRRILPKFRTARGVLDVLFDHIFPHIMKDHIANVLEAIHKRSEHKEDLLAYVQKELFSELTQMLDISYGKIVGSEDRWKGFHMEKNGNSPS